MAGRPHIDWDCAYAYWLSLDPWFPGQLRRWGYSRSNLSRALAPPEMRRSYANVARRFGISRQAVWRYARDHGWRERTREFDRAVSRRVSDQLNASSAEKLGQSVADILRGALTPG
jgi:hypothetical protein